jgi:hypothetical protein
MLSAATRTDCSNRRWSISFGLAASGLVRRRAVVTGGKGSSESPVNLQVPGSSLEHRTYEIGPKSSFAASPRRLVGPAAGRSHVLRIEHIGPKV